MNALEIKGKVNTALCYAKVVEDEAIEQIRRMCDYAMTEGSQIRIMPDVHAGKGCTIGTTMTITDKAVPNVVGVDIGCGMYTVNLGKDEIDFYWLHRDDPEKPVEEIVDILEELKKDYVVGARARGIRERKILVGSVLKASMLTIVTLLSLSIGSLLGGTAIVESIFMWDGVGKLAVDAITMRDYPVIQAYVVWMAIIYVLVNLITDLLYHRLDPRIRLGVTKG